MVVLLCGSNNFLLTQALEARVAEFRIAHGAHSVERLTGEQITLEQLSSLLGNLSLFAPKRLIVIREAQANKLVWDRLATLFEHIPSEITLVLVEPNPDKRTKTYKWCEAAKVIQEFGEQTPVQLTRWLQDVANEAGGTISAQLSAMLVQRVGTDQWRLWHELHKLLAYNPTITQEAIEGLVESNPQASAFDLIDAVFAGSNTKSDQLLNYLSLNEDPYKFMGLLVAQLHALALLVSGSPKPIEQIAKDSGAHSFVLRKMQPLAKTQTVVLLSELISLVARCDEQLKSTNLEPWLIIAQCLHAIIAHTKTEG